MTQQFQADFSQMNQLRSQLSQLIHQTLLDLQEVDTEKSETSKLVDCTRSILTLEQVQTLLQQKTLRLMVLGDLKRGKSTLINAILGAPIVPSDVTPCTAILTQIIYGDQAKVTLHFKGDRPPETLELETFRSEYTIDPTEAKRLDEAQELAFPDISHAVIEYPLDLLQQGLELIDSPGLNDTEARNQLVLNFLQDCHAVIFVLDATQAMTLDERRYLINYLKGKSYPIFYVVNQWDRLEANLLDESLGEAQQKVRETFQNQLAQVMDLPSADIGTHLFELSALTVLRTRHKNPEDPLPESFTRFLAELSHFVSCDRFQAEWNYARRKLQGVSQQIGESAAKQIFLLGETLQSLEAKSQSLQTEFDQLANIRDQYQTLIQQKRDREVEAIAQSFRDYILGLEASFESDFVQSQPDLDFLKFLQKDSRAEFYNQFRRAFERYMNDRLSAWEFIAKQQISRSFEELNQEASDYRVAYSQVVDAINEKLVGDRFYTMGHRYDPKRTGVWVDALQDLFDVIPEQLNNAVGGFNLFWQRVLETTLAYVCIVIALQIIGLIFSSLALNVFAVILAGAGVMTVQAEIVRQEFLKSTQREFAKYLPQIANEQQDAIKSAVRNCFDTYEAEVVDRINMDIAARRGELNQVIEEKRHRSSQSETQIQALQTLAETLEKRVEALMAIAPLSEPG